jgi:methionyl-tRNA formyltransferase
VGDSLSNLRILFAGSGAFGVPTLERLVARGANLVRVYTQPDKPAGRGHVLTPTPVGAWSLAHGVDLVRTDDINREPLPQADLLVVIAFGQKLAPQVVDHARLGAINLHASRLPKYRGAAPINWAVINGDATTGNSVIRLAQKMDAGAVLAMSELPIGELDTAGEIHDRLSLDGADLAERVGQQLADGSARPIEQDHTLASKAPKLSRESATIDWAHDARAIANQIRGMHPWPGCRVRIVDATGTPVDRVTLVRARASSEAIAAEPGTIDPMRGLTACGSSALDIVEIHPDGKRPLLFRDYLRGRRVQTGLRFETA